MEPKMDWITRIGILIFTVLNVGLPTADVTTDVMMIFKLFTGAYGCINPINPSSKSKSWSMDFEEWKNCTVDPDTFCSEMTSDIANLTCNISKPFISYSCEHPENWSQDFKQWEECLDDPSKFCSQQSNDSLICKYERHPKYGISMMIPFLLNYLICFVTWYKLEEDRRTLIFPLMNAYTQLEATRIVFLHFSDPLDAPNRKKKYLTYIGLHEVFLEAIPSTLLLIIIWVVAKGSASVGSNTSLQTIILGNGSLQSTIIFSLTLITSTFSASLGLANGLRYGVAKTIGPGGPLEGFLSGRFILAFLSSGLVLVSRGLIFALHMMLVDTEKIPVRTAIFLGLTFLYLPQLILALFSTLDRRMVSIRILLYHPSLIMLPVFTFFTFSKENNYLCRRSDVPTDSRVMFSHKYTKMNMVISITFYVIYCFVMNATVLTDSDIYLKYYHLFYWANLLLFVLTVSLAISFLYLDSFCCCCYKSFLEAKEEIFVYDPNDPNKTYKLEDQKIIVFFETNVPTEISNTVNNMFRGTLSMVEVGGEQNEMKVMGGHGT